MSFDTLKTLLIIIFKSVLVKFHFKLLNTEISTLETTSMDCGKTIITKKKQNLLYEFISKKSLP